MSDVTKTRGAVHKLAHGWLQAIAQRLAAQIKDGGVDSLKPGDLRTLLEILEATDDDAEATAALLPAAPSMALNPIRAWTLLDPKHNTLARLSRMTGIDRSRLSRYANGHVRPTRETRERLDAATRGALPMAAWTTPEVILSCPVPAEDVDLPGEHRWGRSLDVGLRPLDALRQQQTLLTRVQDWYLRHHEAQLRGVEQVREERLRCLQEAAEARAKGEEPEATTWEARALQLHPRPVDHTAFLAGLRSIVELQRKLADSLEAVGYGAISAETAPKKRASTHLAGDARTGPACAGRTDAGSAASVAAPAKHACDSCAGGGGCAERVGTKAGASDASYPATCGSGMGVDEPEEDGAESQEPRQFENL